MVTRRALAWLVILGSVVLQRGWSEVSAAQAQRPLVVLEPGHGLSNESGIIDPGAVAGDLIEKDITLAVARHAWDFLNRCPVDVFLTREGDDPDHSKLDLHTIVNGYEPSVGVSIHVNSAEGNPSGTEAFYTVDGYDDSGSRHLADLLANRIADQFSIPNRGSIPETSSRHGGLYIHDWQAPSALTEIGFLQGDTELLFGRQRDFGRAIARAVLAFLEVPATCADAAVAEGISVATYYPNETKANSVTLRNDGLVAWQGNAYTLESIGNPYSAKVSYSLPHTVVVGETVTWEIPARAPSRPWVYQQVWELRRGATSVSAQTSVFLIVVPEEARELKEEIDRRIEELRAQGQEELEGYLEDLEQKAIEWAVSEAERLRREGCGALPAGSTVMVFALVGIALRQWLGKRFW
jgi:N-acetylmuramoyl-L-alanine amidase